MQPRGQVRQVADNLVVTKFADLDAIDGLLPLLANVLACLLDATELNCRVTAGLVDGHAFCDVVFHLAGDVVAQLFITLCRAQSTFGEFVGTVTDPTAAAIDGCTITVRNVGTSAIRTTTTDSTGSYTVVNLEPGTYEITMEKPGFQKVTHPNLELLSRRTVRVDSALPVAAQAQAVEVSVQAEAPITTDASSIGESKLGRELIDLPVALGSRATGSTSAFSTLTIQPGVETDNSGNISVVGGNVDMLSMSIDGISTMSPRNSAPMTELFPSFDGIAEIRVSEVNNSADHERFWRLLQRSAVDSKAL